MTFVDYVLCLSYPVETHTVTTDDGYKLTLFRIQAKNTNIKSGKPVVLMWHGLLDSADGWIMNDETHAPGLILANQGHDIWFGNSRGNKYSTGHVSLDHKTSTDYWAFSWMDMSEHDLPAAFTYIAEKTGQKINYIGHSQGTTQMFAALANPSGRNSAITSNLRKYAALGPVTYMAHVKSKLLTTLSHTPLLPEILAKVGKYGIFQPNWVTEAAGKALCTFLPWACSLGISLVADLDPSLDNIDRVGVFAGHFPAGTSVNDILHWKQQVQSGGNFQKYDFGAAKNQQAYGQSTPPRYNPALIQENVALFVGTGDELADSLDAGKFQSEMVNSKSEIHYYPIGHLTFLVGKTLPFMNDLTTFLDLPNSHHRDSEDFLSLDDQVIIA
eukprot:CAMPEP_0176440796 /NCGR_PEP_ID=MMETSP0127-20121128/20792_1 /TAXON_ID=938130 /ORGANISM="Platyophrya macrostoma, Strain WH" /LENGTH=384 /DNA_ID=CAMNT_0017825405 /DNA_START=120 /DNA_END=1274 /DNA_ORIENTATION=+